MSPDSLPWFVEQSWLPWLDVWGRLHPLLVHLPLGVLPVLVLLEAWGFVRRKPLDKGVRRGLVSVSALVAVLAAVAGWLLAEEPAYGGADLELHRKLGVGLAGANLLAMLAAWTGVLKVYGWALAVAFGLLLPAGHLGGSMVHGDDFVSGPLFAALEGERYEPARAAPVVPSAERGGSTSDASTDGVGAGGVVDGAADDARGNDASADEAAPNAAVGDHTGATDVGAIDTGSDYAESIAPLLAARCGNCHGERRQRGALALHTPDDILAGGEFGPALVVGDAQASELIRRLRQPLEHEDHMPPESKTQPTAAEIAMLELWIDGGAPFTGRVLVEGLNAPASVPGAKPFDFDAVPGTAVVLVDRSASADVDTADVATQYADPANVATAPTPVTPDPAAVAALAERLVHVEVLDPRSGLLWLDFAAYASADDAALADLLPPLVGAVGELSLAGTEITDAGLVHVGGLDGLEALDLRRTGVTAAGLVALEPLTALQALNLTSTALDASAVEALAALLSLERVHVYDSGLGANDIARLQAARPGLSVLSGATADDEPLEVEPEVEFVAYVDADAEPGVATTPPADLSPVNTKCPVSGGPVDPRYVVVHDGRAIGFCCTMCPATFWADPAAFAVDE